MKTPTRIPAVLTALLGGLLMPTWLSAQELGANLALSGDADGSSKGGGTSYGNAVDGDLQSYWQPSSSSGERISAKNFGGSFNTVILREIGSATQNWRLVNHDTGQDLTDYIAATAGKFGEMPFNSPLAKDINYVLGLGKVPCQ